MKPSNKCRNGEHRGCLPGVTEKQKELGMAKEGLGGGAGDTFAGTETLPLVTLSCQYPVL